MITIEGLPILPGSPSGNTEKDQREIIGRLTLFPVTVRLMFRTTGLLAAPVEVKVTVPCWLPTSASFGLIVKTRLVGVGPEAVLTVNQGRFSVAVQLISVLPELRSVTL